MKFQKTRSLLLLSATVDPAGVYVGRVDPVVRQRDYLEALEFWLRLETDVRKILFIENSGWPLDIFKERAETIDHDKDIDFVSLEINQYTGQKGKGFGEWRLIEEGISRTRHADNFDHVVKVTGRLMVENFESVLNGIAGCCHLAAENSDSGILRRVRKVCRRDYYERWLDSRLLIWSAEFWDIRLSQLSTELDDSRQQYLERVLFHIVKEEIHKGNDRFIYRLPTLPKWRGVGGGTGERYGSTYSQIRWFFESTVRKIELALALRFPPE